MLRRLKLICSVRLRCLYAAGWVDKGRVRWSLHQEACTGTAVAAVAAAVEEIGLRKKLKEGDNPLIKKKDSMKEKKEF